jgi:hypothetical protein
VSTLVSVRIQLIIHYATAPTVNLQLPRKGPRDSLQLPHVHSSAFSIPEMRLFCYRESHFTRLKGTKDVDTGTPQEGMAKQAAPPSPPAYSISGFSFKCAGALHSLRGEIYNLNNTKHSTAQTRRKRKKKETGPEEKKEEKKETT